MRANFPIIKEVTLFALPLCLTNLLSVVTGIINNLFLAHTGGSSLAAFALANTIVMTVGAFGSMCLYSISILMSKRVARLSELAINGIYLALGIGIITFFIILNGGLILHVFKQDESLINQCHTFFYYSGISMPLLMISSALGQVFIATGRPSVTTFIAVIRIPFILLFNYYFISINGNAGVTAVSKSQFYSQVVSVVIIIAYIIKSQQVKLFSFQNSWQIKVKLIKQMYNIGIHIAMQMLGELSAISIATFMLGTFGVIALTSAQIVGQFSITIVMLTLGVAQTIAVKVAKAHSDGNYSLIQNYINCANYINFGIIILVGIVYYSINSFVLSLFIVHQTDYVQITSLCNKLMLISLCSLMFDSIKNVYSNGLRGLGNSKQPMLIGTLSLWGVGVSLAYLLGIYFNFGVCSLRIGFACGYLASAILIYDSYTRYYLSQIKTL